MKADIKKKREKNRWDILLTLPEFINQLLLLVNSGVPLGIALNRIGDVYERLPEKEQNYFVQEVIKVVKKAKNMGESPVKGFYEFGKSSDVKELSRIGSILIENQNRGTDLRVFLEEQSMALWKDRKQLVLEKIRLGESKMSFPLGILLLTLIIVTSAPAMMQI